MTESQLRVFAVACMVAIVGLYAAFLYDQATGNIRHRLGRDLGYTGRAPRIYVATGPAYVAETNTAETPLTIVKDAP